MASHKDREACARQSCWPVQSLTSLPLFPAYPWDRSSLKSMPLDLRQFEKLDTYASQVGEPAPLPVCPLLLKTGWSVLTQGGKASA